MQISDEELYLEMIENMLETKSDTEYETSHFDINQFFEDAMEKEDAFLKDKITCNNKQAKKAEKELEF